MKKIITFLTSFLHKREYQALLGIAFISFCLHLYLIPRLNIIEDESAYMQDAAQISPHFLPFREFGGTKGPLWLVIFHGWQQVFGRSILVTRLFASFAHIASIFIIWHLARSFSLSKRASMIAALLWGVSGVVVSLTSNITHIPLELCCVLLAFLFLRKQIVYIPVAAALLWAALLMRASAVAFAPTLLLLILMRADRWKALARFCISGVVLILVTLSVVYPLYGWPKTAFFFNADATLIANKQRQVYSNSAPVSFFDGLYNAALPLRLDGLSILIPALLLPVLVAYSAIRKNAWPKSVVLVVCVWVGSFIVFYKGWGRSPTPFYPLESTPALALAAALFISSVGSMANKIKGKVVIFGIFAILFAIDLVTTYQRIPIAQYRGTVEVQAALKVAQILKENVVPKEAIFTAQPAYAYLSYLPLYGGYTHPGWYLSERAGYLPSEIRKVFLPDFDTVAGLVQRDVNWIVVDWRTNDVYFNAGTEATADLRNVLKEDFSPIATIPNPASRDIVIYKRK